MADVVDGAGRLWEDIVAPLLTVQDGVLAASQLRERGVPVKVVRRWVSAGLLVRLRRNALVDGEVWRTSPPWERHAIRARAVLRGRGAEPAGGDGQGAPAALSHHSALSVMGLSMHDVDDLVHLVVPGSTESRRRGGLVQHACVGRERIVDTFGLPTVTPAVACVQVAADFGVEAGLVAADSALRLGHCTQADLEELRDWTWLRHRRPAAVTVIERADGRHESAGESRTAWLLHRLGHRVRPQVVIQDVDGTFVGRVDFLLDVPDARVVVEFDGMLKYESPGDLRAEKLREDRLRAMGYEIVRLTWADLGSPDAVRAKIEAALRRARARLVS
jgi:very-short-patch-repair endonuclease